jgi:hypothetical protein
VIRVSFIQRSLLGAILRERRFEELAAQRQVVDVDQRAIQVVRGIDHEVEPREERVERLVGGLRLGVAIAACTVSK